MEAGALLGFWGGQTGGRTSSGLHSVPDVYRVALIVF